MTKTQASMLTADVFEAVCAERPDNIDWQAECIQACGDVAVMIGLGRFQSDDELIEVIAALVRRIRELHL